MYTEFGIDLGPDMAEPLGQRGKELVTHFAQESLQVSQTLSENMNINVNTGKTYLDLSSMWQNTFLQS